MKLLMLGLATVATLPAITAWNPSTMIVQGPVVTRTFIQSGPQSYVREGMEIRPQTRNYMLVIPMFKPEEPVPQSYTLEPAPNTQVPDLDVPDFHFRNLNATPAADVPKD
jgi:hypothetical protein